MNIHTSSLVGTTILIACLGAAPLPCGAQPAMAAPVRASADQAPAPFADEEDGANKGRKCSKLDAASTQAAAQHLVLMAIDAASKEIRINADVLTAPDVVRALLAARKRGVAVAALASPDNAQDRKGKAAMSALDSAGAKVRFQAPSTGKFHKFIIVDEKHVQYGSYGYGPKASHGAAEKALVCWSGPAIAAHFQTYWTPRWDSAAPFVNNTANPVAPAAAPFDPALVSTWQEPGTGFVLDINQKGKFAFYELVERQAAERPGQSSNKAGSAPTCVLLRSGDVLAPNRIQGDDKDPGNMATLVVEDGALYQNFDKRIDANGRNYWYQKVPFPASCKRTKT